MHFDKESKRNNEVTKPTLLHAGCAHNRTGSICSNKTVTLSFYDFFFFKADIVGKKKAIAQTQCICSCFKTTERRNGRFESNSLCVCVFLQNV